MPPFPHSALLHTGYLLFDEENAVKFETYLIPLLKKKLTDKDCLGIQNLPDDFKQQIKDAIKQP